MLEQATSGGYATLDTFELIGSGTSGTVRKHIDPTSQTVMALKIISLDLQDTVEVAVVEATRDAYAHEHPNIVRLFGVQYFRQEHSIVIALEFMPLRSLKDIIHNKRCNG